MSDARQGSGAVESGDPPFEATIDAGTIRTALAGVEALFDECHCDLGSDGLRLVAIDPATVATVELELDAPAFESYAADDRRVGLPVGRLADVLGVGSRDGEVDLALDPATRQLDVAVDGLEYSLALLDPSAIRSPPDDGGLDFAARVVVDGTDLRRAVRAAAMVSDHVALGVDADDGSFHVEAEGDTDDVTLDLDADDLVAVDPGDARSLFSLDYLTAIARSMPADAEVELELGTEHPLAIRYGVADGAGSVEYALAPRIAR